MLPDVSMVCLQMSGWCCQRSGCFDARGQDGVLTKVMMVLSEVRMVC